MEGPGGGLRHRFWPDRAAFVVISSVLLVLALVGFVVSCARGAGADADEAWEGLGQSGAPEATGRAPLVRADEARGSRVTVHVHVVGAVRSPGLVEVVEGARVAEVIEAAGGPSEDADLESVNLARPVVDGEQVRLARAGEARPQDAPGQGGAWAGGSAQRGCVDLATATAEELQGLDGIGPALAERILRARGSHPGGFGLEELDAVPGIGPALMERVRGGVCG